MRITNAQPLTPCSLITADEVGVLNVQRCKTKIDFECFCFRVFKNIPVVILIYQTNILKSKMFIYSLFALYYVIRSQTYSHFHMSPFTGRACTKRLYAFASPSSKNKAYEQIMKSRYINLPKEEGYDLHLQTSNSTIPEEDKTPVVPYEKEQKRRLDDAETLNGIHHRMFATVFIQRFQKLQEKIKNLAQPDILAQVNGPEMGTLDPRYSKKNAWIKPFDIGSGELWEKFQREGEVW